MCLYYNLIGTLYYITKKGKKKLMGEKKNLMVFLLLNETTHKYDDNEIQTLNNDT